MTERDIDRDILGEEKKAGQKAARTIRRNFKAILATSTVKRSGTLLRIAGATATMKFGELDSITLKASTATFIQHYGFEGIKSNGVRMTLKPLSHFDILFDRSSNALEQLADEIADIRGERITTRLSNMIKLLSDDRAK